MQRKIMISEICKGLNIAFEGNDVEINGLNLCNRKSQNNSVLTYVTSANYVEVVKENFAVKGLVVDYDDAAYYRELCVRRGISIICCQNPEEVFYNIHDYLYYNTDFYDKFLFEAIIGEGCSIHASAVIENGVILGRNVTIGPNSVIRRGTIIKDNCTVGCNSTIGSEGFQILRINNHNRKIIHCGGVVLEECVYVGDNTAVCNTLFEGYTYIGKNAKIDNLVHVGHNGYVGDNAVVTAGTILCGSSIIEDGAWIGVNSAVLNRVTVGKDSKIGIGSVVTRDIPGNSLAYGVPAKVKV